jgi:hypothetical protein
MKKSVYLSSLLKRVLLGAALVATSSLMLTSCGEKEAEDSISGLADQEEISAGLGNGDVLANKYIVVLKEDTNNISLGASYQERVEAVKAHVSGILTERGVNPNAVERTYGSVLKGFAATLTKDEADRLSNDSRVAYVEQDRVITLAPNTGKVTATSTQEVPWGISRVGYASGAGKTAWILDTGYWY